MASVTLEQLNDNIMELKKDVEELKEYMREDFVRADSVKKDIADSRKRPDSEFVKHDDVMKRYS